MEFKCENLEQVHEATQQLDKAHLCNIKVDNAGVLVDVNTHKAVFNINQGKFASAVVPYYNLVQHKDYFDSFAEALERLNIDFNMTIKQSGNRAFADIEFQNRNIKFDNLNEEFATGIRLINSYDKSTGLHVMPRYTRLACTNGMILTRSEKTISIKHHSKIAKEIGGIVEKKISQLINENEDLKNWVSKSIKDSIEWRNTCFILEKLFKQPKHREEILKRLSISMITNKDEKTKKKKFDYVVDNIEDKDKKINRWDLYNAITNYITFGEHITPHMENLFHKNAEKVLITTYEKLPTIKVIL